MPEPLPKYPIHLTPEQEGYLQQLTQNRQLMSITHYIRPLYALLSALL
jgi:hypothetical protein